MSPFKPYDSGSFIFARVELKLHFSYVFKESHEKSIVRLKALHTKASLGSGHEERRLVRGGRRTKMASLYLLGGLVGVCVRATSGRHRPHGAARAFRSPW
jgi:hypothetical protein